MLPALRKCVIPLCLCLGALSWQVPVQAKTPADALRAAQVDEVVRALPQGLETVVGSRGHRFSGGERQRLAIARTLLRDPRILILDEATSALDNDTERELQTALNRLIEGRTTLTIAHRLSTLADADEVVVIHDGRVVEAGTHTSLIARGGRYAGLMSAGFEAPTQHELDSEMYFGRHSRGSL